MIKPMFVILLSLCTANVFAGAAGNIGQHDDRRYGSLSDPEYRGVVKFIASRGNMVQRCTGGFVSKNLIITNSHCAELCKNHNCLAEFWNGSGYEKASLTIVAYYPNYQNLNGTDWAIMLSDKESNFYRPIAPNSTPGQIHRGGFGTLRIIEDSEIPYLKDLMANVRRERQDCKDDMSCIIKAVNAELEKNGRKKLTGDSDNFKVQKCKILRNYGQTQKMIKTDCDSAGGDSGAPLLRGDQIVGLNNSGHQEVFRDDENDGAVGVKTENFYDYAKKAIAKYQNVSGGNSSNSNNSTPATPSETPAKSNTTPAKSNTAPAKLNTSKTENKVNNGQSPVQGSANTNGNNVTQNQPNVTNTGNNSLPGGATSSGPYEDPQQIQQIMNQNLLELDCD